MARLLVGLGLVLGLLTAAGPVASQNTERRAIQSRSERLEAMRQQAAQEAEQKAYWQDLYRKALARERKAESRLQNAQAVWSRGRGDDRVRGEPRARALAEVQAAEKELAEARAQLADIPEQARLAGALPGWLREVEEDFAAAPAPN